MILKLLTTHGTLFDSPVMSSGQVGTFPSLTGARNGQARPNILCRTGRGPVCGTQLLETIRQSTVIIYAFHGRWAVVAGLKNVVDVKTLD